MPRCVGFIIGAFSYYIIHFLTEERNRLGLKKKENITLVDKQLSNIPIEIYSIARDFDDKLNDSIMAHLEPLNVTRTEVKGMFRRFDIYGTHEIIDNDNSVLLQEQKYAFNDFVKKIRDDKISVKNKTELKKLMSKTNIWKNKSELDEFCRVFPERMEAFLKPVKNKEPEVVSKTLDNLERLSESFKEIHK